MADQYLSQIIKDDLGLETLESIKKMAKKSEIKLPLLMLKKDTIIKFLSESKEFISYYRENHLKPTTIQKMIDFNNNNNNNINIENNNNNNKTNEITLTLGDIPSPSLVAPIQLSTPDIIEKCTDPSHLKLSNKYCKECKFTICDKCLEPHHKHDLVDYEEIYEELYKDSQSFLSKLQDNVKKMLNEKVEKEEYFKVEIQDFYERQLVAISSEFRNIHDILHFREVELKRELLSYHDENVETLTTIVSKIDNDINQTNQLIKEIQELAENSKQDKFDFVKNYTNTFEPQFKQDDKKNTVVDVETLAIKNEYRKYASMSEVSIKNLTNVVLGINLVKIKNKKVVDTLIRFNWNRGVEKINFKSGEIDVITDENTANSPNKPNGGYIFQSDFNRGIIYIFDENTYYRLDTTIKEPVWKIGDIPANSMKAYCPSSIFDGKEFIYIVGGYVNGRDSSKTIFKFNVNTEETELIGELTMPSRWHGLTYHDDYIYVMGGYNHINQYLNRIDRFNVKTLKSENIIENLDIYGVTQLKSACYIASTQTYYLFTRDSFFYKYEPNTKACVKLPSPFTKSPIYDLKLNYDGVHNIYLVVTRGLSLYKYNYIKEKWTTYKDVFKYVPTNSDDYVQFQMIN